MASPLPDTSATPRTNPRDARLRPFTRAQFEAAPSEILSRGRWANAVLCVFRQGPDTWVVKDFWPRPFVVRNTVGRFLVRREVCALHKVAGVAGVPVDAFRLDAHALAYRFIVGEPLNQVELGQRNAEFFAALEQLLQQVHAVGSIVHLDVRNTRNVLVSERGRPVVLDFQAHLSTRWMPAPVRRWVERFDLAGVYKHWARRSPDTMGEAREGVLAEMNRWRRLWPLRGYLGARKSHPESVHPPISCEPDMLTAIHGFFNHPGLRSLFVKARVPLGLAAAAGLIWLMDPRGLWPGFAVSMFGELIQLWSFASLNKNRDLACNGPYAVVRNPMYLGRFFIIMGAVMLLRSGWLVLLYALVYYFYMVNRVKREETRLREALGAPYADYCASVHRFLPGPPYQDNPLLFWSWELLRQNHGWANLAGTLAFWAAAIAWSRFGSG